MKAIIVGSGLIGLASAYFLKRSGWEVLVLDREQGPGRETSFANGALITPSMSSPWNTPGVWRHLLTSLWQPDSAMKIRLRPLPKLLGWGVRFLGNSSRRAYERNTVSNLRLGLHSLRMMESLRQETQVAYGRSARGTLRVFRDPRKLELAVRESERLACEGLDARTLSPEELCAVAPALAPIASQLAGALHYGCDESGDAHRFCQSLSAYLAERGVTFRFGTGVSSIASSGPRITSLSAGRERFVADHYVIAAGSYSTPLLRQIGVTLPVQPAKGYSVTFDLPEGRPVLETPIVDDDLHAAITPLEGLLRVAGTAEFAGYDRTLSAARVRSLVALVRRVLPRPQFDAAGAKPWCGLRAMSADGVPIIGSIGWHNVFVNTGHGHLGWTMAAGSGSLLAELMSSKIPTIDPAPFGLERFAGV